MESSYLCRNIVCRNYCNGKQTIIETVRFTDGEKIKTETTKTVIVFITRGDILISGGHILNQPIREGQFMLLPPGMQISVHPLGNVHAVMIHIMRNSRFCDGMTLEELYMPHDSSGVEHTSLIMHAKIKEYINHLTLCSIDLLRCHSYAELKIRELFLLLRVYYSREELACFFKPLVSSDTFFSDFVLKNYRNARNVTELARIANYSLSHFKAKFKIVFGMPALKWLNEQKITNLQHALLYTDKSLKEISDEYHFASVSHLNSFCREKLGMPPGKIRQTRKH